MKAQLNYLKLVYPAISNKKAEYIKNDKGIQEIIKNSHLYMIVQEYNNELRLLSHNEETQEYFLELNINGIKENCKLNLLKLFDLYDFNENEYDLRIIFGRKLIIIEKYNLKTNEAIEIIDEISAYKILQYKIYGDCIIEGIDNINEINKYYLHYVGISKKDDSLTRLVINPHDKRLRILSMETTNSKEFSLSDEINLLFFRVEPIRISIWQDESAEEFLDNTIDYFSIIADAEKALVSSLNSKYNTIRFNDYPKGTDGLYNTGLKRYGYLIGENITLVTDSEIIKGDKFNEYTFGNKADMIFIEGDKTSIERYSDN